MNEPRYVSADPYEDEYNPKVKPKWVTPKTYSERLILSAVGRKGYISIPEHDAVIDITDHISEEPDSDFPVEWVQECCRIAIKMREKGKMIQLKGLLTLIRNADRKREWYDKNIRNRHIDNL